MTQNRSEIEDQVQSTSEFGWVISFAARTPKPFREVLFKQYAKQATEPVRLILQALAEDLDCQSDETVDEYFKTRSSSDWTETRDLFKKLIVSSRRESQRVQAALQH